tara:strand:- start:7332 stop:8051 length:720 start_codon:yes stop_codon:yes gene_type:complete
MGKTLRKFSKKGKKTQYRRKTKGRKPIRRKSVRRGKKMGGDADAGVKLNKKVEAIKTYIKEQDSSGSINQGNLMLQFKPILASKGKDGKESCRSKYGFSNWTCERKKFDAYVKAKHLAEKYLPNLKNEKNYAPLKDELKGQSLIDKLDEKIATRKSHAAEIESYSKSTELGADGKEKGKIESLKEKALEGLENIKSDAEKLEDASEDTIEKPEYSKMHGNEPINPVAPQLISRPSPRPI